jgi:hypothetical protein
MDRQHRWQQTKHQTSKQIDMARAKALQCKWQQANRIYRNSENRSKPKEHGQNQCKCRGMSQNGGFSQSIKPKPTLARQVPKDKSNSKNKHV